MKILFVVLLFLCVSLSRAEEPFKGFLDAFPDADTSELIKMPETEDFIDVKLPEYAACPTLAVPADTNNVNALKPGHIKAIAAMGDSITCGSAAKDSSLISTKEYRGLSFCIGADAGVTTFTNILKGIIPTLTVNGGSLGTGGRTSTGNGLNAAVSGAVNSDMLSQAKWLVAQMRNATSKVNINSDWKVLTIWIGSNNLCKVCSDATNNNGANYETKVTEALQYLYDNVPRLFVNLVASLDVSKIYGINTGICNTVHSIACSCIMATNNRATVAATAKDYVAKAHTIAKAFNGRRTDFAVVVQPFLANATIADRNLLSAADCFHPSALGHQLASVALWNNMLTPAASKKTTWSTTDTPICPTANSIFPTN